MIQIVKVELMALKVRLLRGNSVSLLLIFLFIIMLLFD